jgi:dihydroflavonol-4-reductase
MKVLVTGSNGFIGSWLVEKLLDRGDTVRCLVRKTSNLRWLEGLQVQFVYGELLNESSLVHAVQDVECVFHLAGVTKACDRAGYFLANYQGTVNLLNACKSHGAKEQKFIFISSLAAAGPAPTPVPLKEDDHPHPVSAYGEAKLAAEKAVLEMANHRPVTILRPPPVYGPRDTDVYEIFRYVKRYVKPVIGGGERLSSLVHVDDLVRGILLSADSPKASGRVYFICNDIFYDWKTIGDEIARIMDKRALTLTVPSVLLDVVSFFSELGAKITSKPPLLNRRMVIDMKQRYWICDNSRAKNELGFEPQISLSDGIAQTFYWYRANGWL